MSRLFRCEICGQSSTMEEWDNITVEKCCVNRNLKRRYVSIGKWTTQSKWYKCPKCMNNVKRRAITEVLDTPLMVGPSDDTIQMPKHTSVGRSEALSDKEQQ